MGLDALPIEDIQRQASAGNVEAKAALGRRLVLNPSLDPSEGIRLTAEAAQAGSGEAAHLLAVLDASGRVGAPDWPRALQLLQRSCELGFARAQRELALLAGDAARSSALARGETLKPETWDSLRRAVDVSAWLAVPASHALHSSPRIGVCERFASPALCNWLIERGRPHLKSALIDDPATGQPVYGQARTNSTADLSLADTDVAMHLLRARMLALAGPAAFGLEGIAILHYEVGQQFLQHYDFLDPAMPGANEQVTRSGQRVLTILIYLNEGYEGGETNFPFLSWRFKGGVGDALFFWNVDGAGKPDRLTLHAGTPPLSGEKWLLSQWVRGRVT